MSIAEDTKKSIEFLKQTRHTGIIELFNYLDFVAGKVLNPYNQDELNINNNDIDLLLKELTEIKKLADRLKSSISKKITPKNDKIDK